MLASEVGLGLELRGIRKAFGTFEVAGEFEVRRGERAALIGPSGSGKTTLLRIIAGLEAPDGGQVLLEGRDLTGLPPEARGIGVVFQDQALFPSMSVFENAAFALRMRKVARRDQEKAVMPWLEKVGLSGRRDSNVQSLSGGERQRVALVRAISWKPSALLLDEPFSALDIGLRAQLRRELVAMHELWPVPLLVITHDPDDVTEIANVRVEAGVSGGAFRIAKPSGRE